MVPVWVGAAARVRKELRTRQIPLLSLGAAFCFTVMMFNIPALGGTTAHPVAGTLLAVMLGPAAAIVGVSVALGIQALLFGDGGLLAYGANCFTMAFALPVVGYFTYSLLSRKLGKNSRYQPVCAGIGAYAGINMAAILVAIALGVQPALFHEPNGHAIYFPFGLAITLPAMLGTHLLIAGPAEAIVTALAVAYLQRSGVGLYTSAAESVESTGQGNLLWQRLYLPLLVLIALTPLGLLAKGDAWGEWNAAGVAAQIEHRVGAKYTPAGVAAGESYNHHGIGILAEYGATSGQLGYVLAAICGALTICAALAGLGIVLARRDSIRIQSAAAEPIQLAAGTSTTTDSLPSWLANGPAEAQSVTRARPSNPYLVKSLAEFARRTADVLGREVWPTYAGKLQAIDARAKLASLLLLLSAVTVTRHLVLLAAMYCFLITAAAASGIPIGQFARRVWLAVPLFIGGIILPTALSIVTPGHELFNVWIHPHIAVTSPGLHLAAVIMVRIGVAISLGALVALTTRWSALLAAARSLGVPRLFVGILELTYRYMVLMMNTAVEMFEARTTRTVGHAQNSDGRQYVGTTVGMMLGKTIVLSEEVHDAMTARGFTGDVRTLRGPKWRRTDSAFLVSCLVLAILLVSLDKIVGNLL